MTAIVRTLGGVPVAIAPTVPEAHAMRCSEFHRVTPDWGGTWIQFELYATGYGLSAVNGVKVYGASVYAAEVDAEVARYHALNGR